MALVMNTGNSFTPGSTTLPLSHIHTFFSFHSICNMDNPHPSVGSVNMPTNRQCAGVPWNQVVVWRGVALKKQGAKVEQSMDSSFRFA